MSIDDKPSNIEQLLIDLHEAHIEYKRLLDDDEYGISLPILSSKGRYRKLLDMAFETGYALKRKYGLE